MSKVRRRKTVYYHFLRNEGSTPIKELEVGGTVLVASHQTYYELYGIVEEIVNGEGIKVVSFMVMKKRQLFLRRFQVFSPDLFLIGKWDIAKSSLHHKIEKTRLAYLKEYTNPKNLTHEFYCVREFTKRGLIENGLLTREDNK